MPTYVVKFNQDELNYLDRLAAIHRRKPFLQCNSSKVQSEIDLFKLTPNSNGFLTLLYVRLQDNKIQAGLDDRTNTVKVFDTSCNQINRIMKSFFADIRESKRNAEAKSASKVQKRPVFA